MVSNQDSTDGKDSEDFSNPVAVDPEKHDFSSKSKILVLFSKSIVLGRLICNFHFVTLRFYVKSNFEILDGQKLQFWPFWRS